MALRSNTSASITVFSEAFHRHTSIDLIYQDYDRFGCRTVRYSTHPVPAITGHMRRCTDRCAAAGARYFTFTWYYYTRTCYSLLVCTLDRDCGCLGVGESDKDAHARITGKSERLRSTMHLMLLLYIMLMHVATTQKHLPSALLADCVSRIHLIAALDDSITQI